MSVSKTQATQFPITSLGNCRNVKECFLYCEIPQNKAACWAYSVYGVTDRVLGTESPESSLQALGITFPIIELENCASLIACKAYCDDKAHAPSCQAYGQKSGLAGRRLLVTRAVQELGCTTLDECRRFCHDTTNREQCHAFARRYHLRATTIKDQLLEQANVQLGCKTVEECARKCLSPSFRETCHILAQQFGIGLESQFRLLRIARDELGCTSIRTCREWCEQKENMTRCQDFARSYVLNDDNRVTGECTSRSECRRECEAMPELCPDFPNSIKKHLPNDITLPDIDSIEPPRRQNSTLVSPSPGITITYSQSSYQVPLPSGSNGSRNLFTPN